MKLLKQISALLCSGLMAAACAAEPFSAFAAEEATKPVQFSADKVTAEPGETISYSIKIDQNETGFAAGGFCLSFTAPVTITTNITGRPKCSLPWLKSDAEGYQTYRTILSPDKQAVALTYACEKNITTTGDFAVFEIQIPEDLEPDT